LLLLEAICNTKVTKSIACLAFRILPVELELPSIRIAIDKRLNDEESFQERMVMLEKLDEVRNQAYLNMAPFKNGIKHTTTAR
jgi:hypothetical protein